MVNAWVAVAGILATLGAAIGAVIVAQRAENRRWYAQQVHLGNVSRADRLRSVYGQIAQAAISLRLVIGERSFLFDGQSVEERDERHDRMVGEALGRVQDVGAQVLIESSAETVQDTYTRVVHAVDTLKGPETLQPGLTSRNSLNEAYPPWPCPSSTVSSDAPSRPFVSTG